MGSRWPSNSYAEVYLTDFGHWKKLEKYPFDKDSKIFFANSELFLIHNEDIKVGYYAAVYYQDAFYLFGGMVESTEFSNTIARLDTRTTSWSKVGCPTEIRKFKILYPT